MQSTNSNHAMIATAMPTELDNEISLMDQEAKISELAYFKAEARGFETGHELNDWLAAEQDYFGAQTTL